MQAACVFIGNFTCVFFFWEETLPFYPHPGPQLYLVPCHPSCMWLFRRQDTFVCRCATPWLPCVFFVLPDAGAACLCMSLRVLCYRPASPPTPPCHSLAPTLRGSNPMIPPYTNDSNQCTTATNARPALHPPPPLPLPRGARLAAAVLSFRLFSFFLLPCPVPLVRPLRAQRLTRATAARPAAAATGAALKKRHTCIVCWSAPCFFMCNLSTLQIQKPIQCCWQEEWTTNVGGVWRRQHAGRCAEVGMIVSRNEWRRDKRGRWRDAGNMDRTLKHVSPCKKGRKRAPAVGWHRLLVRKHETPCRPVPNRNRKTLGTTPQKNEPTGMQCEEQQAAVPVHARLMRCTKPPANHSGGTASVAAGLQAHSVWAVAWKAK